MDQRVRTVWWAGGLEPPTFRCRADAPTVSEAILVLTGLDIQGGNAPQEEQLESLTIDTRFHRP
jgi:hypothetical protein